LFDSVYLSPEYFKHIIALVTSPPPVLYWSVFYLLIIFI